DGLAQAARLDDVQRDRELGVVGRAQLELAWRRHRWDRVGSCVGGRDPPADLAVALLVIGCTHRERDDLGTGADLGARVGDPLARSGALELAARATEPVARREPALDVAEQIDRRIGWQWAAAQVVDHQSANVCWMIAQSGGFLSLELFAWIRGRCGV